MNKPDTKGVWFHLSPFQAALILVLVLLPWFILAGVFTGFFPANKDNGSRPKEASASVAEQPAGISEKVSVYEGDWGILEVEEQTIEPSQYLFFHDITQKAYNKWRFPGMNRENVRVIFEDAGVAKEKVDILLAGAQDLDDQEGIMVMPSPEVQASFPPEVRSRLYQAIGMIPGNYFLRDAFYYKCKTPEEWFKGSGLPESITRMVIPLMYKRNHYHYFNDLHLVIPKIASPVKRVRLQQILRRSRILKARLRIPSDQNISALKLYWEGGARDSQIEAIVNAEKNAPGTGTIDIVYFLPPFASARLYTFVNPYRFPDWKNMDCHWTALNFFNEIPDDRFGKEDINIHIKSLYKEVKSAPEFGDFMIFVNQDGVIVHSCNYIAADIVFTKNGKGVTNPFSLAYLQDVIEIYEDINGPLEVVYFRLKTRFTEKSAPDAVAPLSLRVNPAVLIPGVLHPALPAPFLQAGLRKKASGSD